MAHSLLAPRPKRQVSDTAFLPSSSSPFLFLKKIVAWQKGPSCGDLWPPSVLSKALMVLKTLPREGGRPVGKVSNSHQQRTSSGASERNSRLTPDSDTCSHPNLSHSGFDRCSLWQPGRLASAVTLLGFLSCSAIPRPRLRRRGDQGENSKLPRGSGRVKAFWLLQASKPSPAAWRELWTRHCSPARKQAWLSLRGENSL
jgi:hypothetical protein